ncbi:hypothetical protein GCM10009808_09360 [Microbacterium sediminicola]|uniref:AbiEi antitoxin N-terminal domain-containing protein n=1 Tax=Microbacterium sediminicola TaxID=415210 RepID=A0ABN2HWE3_9MICO
MDEEPPRDAIEAVLQARGDILTTSHLMQSGLSGRAIARAVATGELHVLGRGTYVLETVWAELYGEARHRLEVVAASMRMFGSSFAFSHVSAAVLWGLPLFRHPARAVHLAGVGSDGVAHGRFRGIARHDVDLDARDRAEVAHVPCTNLERTVYDVIRTTRLETAVTVADAALRLAGADPTHGGYQADRAEAWRLGLWRRIARHPGARGIRQARVVAGFADGRAQLPGESVSRLYLRELGFDAPRLQVPVPTRAGTTYYVDFGLDDVHAWGEFDGVGKYTDPGMLAGRSGREVLLAEKEREDWIRATTGRPVVRWGMPQLSSPQALRTRLAESGIHPPR